MQKYKIIDIPYYKYKDNTIAYIKISHVFVFLFLTYII